MAVSAWPIIRAALGDFRRAWAQLVLADLVALALIVAVLTPAVGLLLQLFLVRTATVVVTDQAIVSFLLHPIGLTALLVVGTAAAAALFIESSQLMVIGFGAMEGRRITWLDALAYAYRRGHRILALAGLALIRLLRAAVPFLAALGLLSLLLAGAHDVNYYLSARPPEFLASAAAAALVTAALSLRIVHLLAGWIISLPLVLFEDRTGRQALAASLTATAGRRRALTFWLSGWVLIRLLAPIAVSAALTAGANLLVPRGRASLALTLGVLAGLIVISLLASLAVTMMATILFPLLVTRLYRALAGPGQLGPEPAPVGSPHRGGARAIPGKWALAAIVLVLLANSGGTWLLLDDYRWDEPVQIIAHRGGAAVAPENTMAAFRQAIGDGADWIELDVQENADGTVIVQHDKDFMRLARSPLRVWNATDAALADLDMGSFFDARFAGERTPTLQQVLELARGRTGVFIELKYYGHNVSLEQKVVDLVESSGMAEHIVIMSLDLEGLQRAAALRPHWTYGLLNAVALGDMTRLELDFLALSARGTSLAAIRRAHRRGKKVYAWTINDPVQMWVMMSWGVDGIITDRVALAREILELRESMTPLGRWIVWLAGETGLLDGMERSSKAEDA